MYHESILKAKKGKTGFSRETISVLSAHFIYLATSINWVWRLLVQYRIHTMNALVFSYSQESRVFDATCDIIIKISLSIFLYILNTNRNKVRCIRYYYSTYFYELRNIQICQCESIHSRPICMSFNLRCYIKYVIMKLNWTIEGLHHL